MGFLRALVCILCPPLAVLDKGCGSILIVTFLTIAGWIPGAIAALMINLRQQEKIIIIQEETYSRDPEK